MRADVAARFLADRRRAEIGWSIGIAVYTALMMVLWPTIRDSEGYQTAAQDLPEAFDAFFGPGGIDLASPEGFLNTYLFGMMLPLVLIIAGVAGGAAIIGGEEENGTLELLLAHPLTRRRIVVEKAVAIITYLALFSVVFFVTVVALAPAVDMDVAVGKVAAATLGSWLAGAVYALAALTIGAVTGRRGSAAALAGALAGLGYLLQVVAELAVDWDGLRYLSPMYLANGASPVENGIPGGYYLALGAAVFALAVAAAAAFERRDLRA